MSKRDRSLAVRFFLWWIAAVGVCIALCAAAYYVYESRAQLARLKQETRTLAAVVAPRVTHDLVSHVAGYMHRTLRCIQGTEKAVAISIYGKNGAMLFSTHPVFRRGMEIPPEVAQTIRDRQERWRFHAAEDRAHVFYPLLGKAGIVGVLQITRDTENLSWIPAGRTFTLVAFCSFVAVVASGFLLLFLRRHYFQPLKELNAMMAKINQPFAHAALEIPASAFHGELAASYRHVGQLAQGLADARKTLESRGAVKSAVEKIQEEMRFLSRQTYERRMDHLDALGGYDILSKPVQAEHWGHLWKSAVEKRQGAAGARKVLFSFWNSKNEGLKAALQGFQWDALFADLAQGGKGLEEISDELFMEFGLDLKEWLLGQWDAGTRRLELVGNVWACHWEQGRDHFSFLSGGQALGGARKQGFQASWPFVPGDKLMVFNADAFESPGGAGLEAFVSLLSKNIKSTPHNLMDLLLRELEDRRLLAPEAGLLLCIHSVMQVTAPSAAVAQAPKAEGFAVIPFHG